MKEVTACASLSHNFQFDRIRHSELQICINVTHLYRENHVASSSRSSFIAKYLQDNILFIDSLTFIISEYSRGDTVSELWIWV